MSGDRWVVNDEYSEKMFLQFVQSQRKAGRVLEFRWAPAEKKSDLQNNAMWLWFEMIATALNDAGLDMRKMLKESVSINWTKDSVRAYLWGAIQEALTGKKSTRALTKEEFSLIQETLARHLAEKKGIAIQFPSKETKAAEYG